ncbi:MAG: FAD-dependent oxidoreductase [Thioalkalispiraceae bacterium]|jgi:rubredoxin-NAD+ reductase
MTSIVIIGTGLAGYNLAREIRKRSTDIKLTLVTRDDGAFYSKPMLSNALTKQKQPAELSMADADKMRSDLDATILTHTHVTAIDPANRSIQCDNGEQLSYDKLVLATGANPVQFPMQGDGVAEVLVVNNLNDYTRFRTRLQSSQAIAIIGPGLIGCEFANDLASNGYAVTVIGPDQAPMSTLLPTEAGQVLQGALSKLGVEWRLELTVNAINKTQTGYQLVLSNGQTLEADLVLSAIGLRADTRLADAIGLDCQRGIVVDRYLQSSDENIYALGDCAEVSGLFMPFVMPLMNCARALAATLCGEPAQVSYPAMPVLVKTPAMPTIVAPPAIDTQGEWEFTSMDNGIKALYKQGDQLLGFVLMGDAASEKQALTKELPAVLN